MQVPAYIECQTSTSFAAITISLYRIGSDEHWLFACEGRRYPRTPFSNMEIDVSCNTAVFHMRQDSIHIKVSLEANFRRTLIPNRRYMHSNNRALAYILYTTLHHVIHLAESRHLHLLPKQNEFIPKANFKRLFDSLGPPASVEPLGRLISAGRTLAPHINTGLAAARVYGPSATARKGGFAARAVRRTKQIHCHLLRPLQSWRNKSSDQRITMSRDALH